MSKYLFNIIPTSVSTCNTRNTSNIPLFKVKHNFFQNSFFSSAVIEWNKLDLNIRISERFNIFKKTRLNFIRPSGSTVFNCHNPKGFKLLSTLRLGLTHLREHNFKHSFQDSLNHISSYANDIETSDQRYCSFLRVFCSQSGKFGKLILKRFWSVLC